MTRAGSAHVSASTLKAIALFCMTACHAGHIFLDALPQGISCALIALGGPAYPIFAFLLVEGYHRTSNLKRYAIRLLAFALISFAPFWLFLGHELDVLFTLALGLLVLWLNDSVESRLLFWAGFAVCCAASLWCDWPVIGLVVIYLYAKVRANSIGLRAACWVIGVMVCIPYAVAAFSEGGALYMSAAAGGLFGAVVTSLALPLYDGRKGVKLPRYFFYAFYPAHILVLGLIRLVAFGAFPLIIT